MRQLVQEPSGHCGDGHVHGEGHRGTDPDGGGLAATAHDEGGDHGLVRQLGEEDHAEDAEGETEVHCVAISVRVVPICPDSRWANATPTIIRSTSWSTVRWPEWSG